MYRVVSKFVPPEKRNSRRLCESGCCGSVAVCGRRRQKVTVVFRNLGGMLMIGESLERNGWELSCPSFNGAVKETAWKKATTKFADFVAFAERFAVGDGWRRYCAR